MLSLFLRSCSLSIRWKKWKKMNCWWMPSVSLILCSQPKLSLVSVVFDFNASLNDAAPASLILFPVDLMRMKKSWLLMDFICVQFLFLYNSDRAPWVLCLISMHRSMILLLFLQYCSLLIWRERKKSELLMDFMMLVSFVFTIQIEFDECCVCLQCFT